MSDPFDNRFWAALRATCSHASHGTRKSGFRPTGFDQALGAGL